VLASGFPSKISLRYRSPKIECKGAPLPRQGAQSPEKSVESAAQLHDLVDVHNFLTQNTMGNQISSFQGICIETGAQRSVVGKDQAKAYSELCDIRFRTKPSLRAFHFGDGVFKVSAVSVRILTQDGNNIKMDMDFVQADVPMLIGLEVLDRECLVAEMLKINSVQQSMVGHYQ
jgi:hypothetical protein